MIGLTQDLVRIPTLNPPGRDYRLICEYLDTRLRGSGLATELIRAHGGAITLVGAGPGDPELLTLKASKALDTADVVIHDRLVGAGVLALAAPSARDGHRLRNVPVVESKRELIR